MAYVKCPKCGTKINVDTYGMVNCSKCGYAVRAVAKKPVTSQAGTEKQSTPPPKPILTPQEPKVSTKKCKHCASDIPMKAKVCPHCRRKQKGGKLKWFIIALFVLGVIGNLPGGNDDAETKSAKSESKQEDKVKNKKTKKKSEKKIDEEPSAIDSESPEVENTEIAETQPTNIPSFEEELARFSSGEYLYITNSDLNTYCANMGGAKVYVVTDIDSMTDDAIQSTLSDGYMMSGFHVGGSYARYETFLNEGDIVAISGTVSGYDGYGFMGTSVELTDCQVFAMGDEARAYQKEASDPGLAGYFYVTEEVANSNSDDVSEADFKALCQTLGYEDVLRNPEGNRGKYCVVSGTVDQIIEGWFGSFSIFINDAAGNRWGCVYSYKDGESHLLEGDSVTVYGKCEGTDTNRTLLGQQVTMPRVDVEYIN